MKRKYFVRGLGTGIIFSSIVILVAYTTSGGFRMKDDEVIRRAKELGMVQQEEYVIPSTETSVTTQTANNDQQITTEEVTTKQQTTELVTTEQPTTEKITTEKVTTEEQTTETQTTEKQTTEVTSEEKKPSGTKATITVSSGMSSEGISKLLEDAGLIKSASDFNSFLIGNGYDKKLEIGSFDIDANMSYEEIAKVLTTKQK